MEEKHKSEGKCNVNPEPEEEAKHAEAGAEAISIEKKGWMCLKDRVSLSYKRRYYCMFSGERQTIWYFNHQTDGCAQGMIAWKHNITLKKVNTAEFVASASGHQWYFLCDDERHRDEWYAVISAYCWTQQHNANCNAIEGYGYNVDQQSNNSSDRDANDTRINLECNAAPIPFSTD
eukprot:CAMPEP_0202694438 /NCGR_PEP_ID=MMETSP1385-20130828/8306_1 /ASSEMBLY_ACC=CAM_ASM_000861 /TAXON_ID=933848 /ORGANISM="Elphidium margaritaceum" /LENGTH=175 /DNA_ID=CAMNT_0049350285 /DNA_START=255 /DNA_END=782 /DNA_ORIENTATION=-